MSTPEILNKYHLKTIDLIDQLNAVRQSKIESDTKLMILENYVHDLIEALNGEEVNENLWPLINDIERLIKD